MQSDDDDSGLEVDNRSTLLRQIQQGKQLKKVDSTVPGKGLDKMLIKLCNDIIQHTHKKNYILLLCLVKARLIKILYNLSKKKYLKK